MFYKNVSLDGTADNKITTSAGYMGSELIRVLAPSAATGGA
jgi:hypothetical protein